MNTCVLILLVPLALGFSSPQPAAGAINEWTKPTSGYWEEQAAWSLGVLPDVTQSVVFNNTGWKALAIGTNTAQNFPQSLHVVSLHVGAPVDSYNTLLMNFSGLEQPLQTGSLTVDSNGAVVMQSSALEVTGDLLLGGSFNHADFSQVKVYGALNVGWAGVGTYFLTNGTLSVDGIGHESAESIFGGFQGQGRFVQHGGSNNARNIQVDINGEFELYGGQTTATNGITIGLGDYANLASFHQYGGNVNADTAINGKYFLEGGQITGHMSVVSANAFQRVDAFVSQSGGTNSAISLDLGHPNRFGGRAFYVLSNGVVNVDSSTTFRGGEFSQYDGRHTIVSNLVLQGTDLGGLGFAGADYFLWGGTLSAGGLTVQASRFQQNGGTNSIAGNIMLSGPYPQGTPEWPRYVLGGGLLSASNVFVSAFFGGFQQTGGTHQITERLTMQGTNYGGFQYSLEGGTLVVKDILVSSNAVFQHTSGNIVHSGLLTLNQGGWRAATGVCSLGPLRLTGGPNTNSTLSFPGGASILRLADSSAQPWAASALLSINNWHGSATGGCDTQLYFGSNASGLTPQQIALIQFDLSGELSPARILATGEVVPQRQPLAFTSNPDVLILSWTGDYQLLSATNVTGPYVAIPGATSPFTNAFVGPQRFFRLGSLAP